MFNLEIINYIELSLRDVQPCYTRRGGRAPPPCPHPHQVGTLQPSCQQRRVKGINFYDPRGPCSSLNDDADKDDK